MRAAPEPHRQTHDTDNNLVFFILFRLLLRLSLLLGHTIGRVEPVRVDMLRHSPPPHVRATPLRYSTEHDAHQAGRTSVDCNKRLLPCRVLHIRNRLRKPLLERAARHKTAAATVTCDRAVRAMRRCSVQERVCPAPVPRELVKAVPDGL